MSEPTAPAPAPDAAAAPSDAAPAPPPPPAPAGGPEGEAPEGTEGQVDLATLPQAVQEYIRELRDEAKNRRLEHDPFKKAFAHFNQAEQEYLLNMVDSLGVNQEAGAQAMLDLSQRLLGIEQAATEVAEEVTDEEAKAAGLTPDQVRQMIAEEQQQAQIIAQIHAETEAVGFKPGTPEANKLWDLAVALDEPDLAKVAPIARQALGIPEPENAEAQPAPDAEPPPPTQFPSTPSAGGAGNTNHEEREPIPAIKSDAMRERIRRRIEAAAGQ